MKTLNKILFAGLFITLLTNAANSQLTDNWKWLNPKPQGNTLYAVDFVDNNTGYSVGEFGTIVKTTDDGLSWIQIFTGNSSPIYCVNFLDAETGYIGGINELLKKTINGGVSWTDLTLPSDPDYYILSVDFVNQNTGYVLGFFELESKIWKTTDGGNSWTTQTTSGANYLNTLYFLNENYGFALGGSLGSEIIKTTNGGETWDLVEYYNYSELLSIHFKDASTGFVGGQGGVVLMTNDSGSTWTQVGSPSSLGVHSLLFTDSNTGFGIGSANVYIKTTNGGLNWTEEFTGNYSFNMYYDGIVTPAGTMHAVGSFGGMLRSTNSGASWSLQYSVAEETLSDLTFTNDYTGYAICGYSGGNILKTTDAGETWASMVTGYALPMYGIKFTNSQTGYIAGSLTIYKTTNAGINWETSYSSNYDIYSDIDFVNDNVGYAVGSYGKIVKTTNAGDSWTESTINIPGTSLTSIDFVNDLVGYTVGDDGGIMKTTDGGGTWIQQTSELGFAYMTTVNFTDESTGYISSGQGLIRTTNGGENWILLSTPYSSYYKVQFRNNFGYAVSSDGKIIKSIDAGDTWLEQPTVTVNGLYALYFNSDNFVYAGGTRGTILKTTPTELIIQPALNLYFTGLLEGFYDNTTNTMIRDTVRVYLRNASSPFVNVDSSKAVLDQNGNGAFEFTNSNNGVPYYIIVKHRNSIETWSSFANSFASNELTYDFSTSSSMAFGNNMKLKGSRWTFFGGDVNRDGIVDLSDLTKIFNDGASFVSGYSITDVTGDNFVDLSDLLFAFENSRNFVSIVRP